MSEKRFRITTLPKSDAVAFDEQQKKYYIGIDFEDLLNDLLEEKEYFERKKEYFLSKWSIAHTENIQLRQEVAELKTRNAVLSSKLNQIPESIKREWLEDE